MKIWVTRYALTTGITVHESVKVEGRHASVKYPGCINNMMYVYKPDWYDNEADALLRAEEMRQNKVSSLEKQIDKLSKMTFFSEECWIMRKRQAKKISKYKCLKCGSEDGIVRLDKTKPGRYVSTRLYC